MICDHYIRGRMWQAQDRLITLLLAQDTERDWSQPAWEGGPTLSTLNLELLPEHAERVQVEIRRLEGRP